MGQFLSAPYWYSYLGYLKRYTSTFVPSEDVEWTINDLGRIKGKIFQIEGGQKVHAFLGVPFAKCGEFQDRFKKPEPVEPWTDLKDCRDFGPRSLQVDMIWDYLLTPVPQDETNCLHMNIFVPELTEEEKVRIINV
jgi:carboxylesterase type B